MKLAFWQIVNGVMYISAAGGMGIIDPNPANSESIYVFSLP